MNTHTSKPDCIACTEAKQFVEPYGQVNHEKTTKPGDLTHIDVWGKYDTVSIHCNQYFLLMVDDASQYVTTEFLKEKKEDATKVKKYLAKLISHNKKPKANHIVWGKEFLNVMTWCQENGIDIQKTAPYLSSKNDIAKRMNHTLLYYFDQVFMSRVTSANELNTWDIITGHSHF